MHLFWKLVLLICTVNTFFLKKQTKKTNRCLFSKLCTFSNSNTFQWHRRPLSLVLTEILQLWSDGLPSSFVPQRLKPSDFSGPVGLFPAALTESHFWFWVKCLDNYQLNCHDIWQTAPIIDPLMFHLVLSSGQHSICPILFFCDQLPKELH